MNHYSAPTSFELSIIINAPIERVWASLTDIEQMKTWMGELEMAVQIDVDWVIGSPIVVRGVHTFPSRTLERSWHSSPKLASHTHI